jgi:hypothetical protein
MLEHTSTSGELGRAPRIARCYYGSLIPPENLYKYKNIFFMDCFLAYTIGSRQKASLNTIQLVWSIDSYI